MPTYDYHCKECGHRFEAFQRMTEEPLQNCPKCNGKVERLISQGNGFIFKGSGFYATDYRSDSYKKAKESETSPPKSESTKKTDKESAK